MKMFKHQDGILSEQYWQKAMKYTKEGEFKEAIKYINKFIALLPIIPDGYSLKADILKKMKNEDEAIKNSNIAIKYKNNNPLRDSSELYHNRAGVFIHFGRYEDALEDCNMAISIAPHDKRLYYQRGLCYEYLGKPDLAIVDYKVSGHKENIEKLL